MTTYIATCRAKECLWHRAPAEFADYGERASETGKHRVQTGHQVDYTTREAEHDTKPLYLWPGDGAMFLICERQECMVATGTQDDDGTTAKVYLGVELPWECTPAEAMRTAADHIREEHR